MASTKTSYETTLVEILAKLINDQNLAEIEYDTEGLRLRLTRTFAPVANSGVCVSSVAPASVATAAPVAVPSAFVAVPDDYASHPGVIKSPMVGVIYASPEPNSASYVSVGDMVSADQTLFLVEAMKTFNPIKAPRAGKVTKILISDRSPVEYDEPLLILE